MSFSTSSRNSTKPEKAASEIAKELKAEIDEIVDLKDRKMMFIGFLVSGMDAAKGNLTKIKYKKDASKFDLVIIGTPIWAGTLTPAVRTSLTRNKPKKVAFFCTCEGDGRKAFDEMQKLGKKPIATLIVSKKDLKEHSYGKIKNFCKRLL